MSSPYKCKGVLGGALAMPIEISEMKRDTDLEAIMQKKADLLIRCYVNPTVPLVSDKSPIH